VMMTVTSMMPFGLAGARFPRLASAYGPSRTAVRLAEAADTATSIDDSSWTLSETGLRYLDTTVGGGETPRDGDTVKIHYTGRLPSGEVFDSSKGKSPLKFEIGGGRIIPGWNEGVKSMNVDGKRTLSIPPELGFGMTGSPDGKVKPNSKIFVECELVELERGGIKIAGLEMPKYDPRALAVVAVLAIPYLLPPGTLPDEIAFIWGK